MDYVKKSPSQAPWSALPVPQMYVSYAGCTLEGTHSFFKKEHLSSHALNYSVLLLDGYEGDSSCHWEVEKQCWLTSAYTEHVSSTPTPRLHLPTHNANSEIVLPCLSQLNC